MIRSKLLPILLLSLPLGLGGCSASEFYDREYVFYDSTQEQEPVEPAEAEPETAEATGEAEAGEAVATEAAASAADLERIFLLEGMHDELGRAIRDGVGDLDALRQKQQDIGREIAWRREAAGDAYDQARRERLEQLREFPITVK